MAAGNLFAILYRIDHDLSWLGRQEILRILSEKLRKTKKKRRNPRKN
jgi:hypothetical protein